MLALQNFLFFLGCAVFPLYLFPAGGIQVGHVLLVCAACLALLGGRVRFSAPAAILLVLGAVAFSREAFAVISGAPRSVLVQAAYLWFNTMIFVAVQTAYAGSRSVLSYKWGFIAAVAIALGTVLTTGLDVFGEKVVERNIGTFENANQLAYFITITFSLVVLLYTFGRISGGMMAAVAIACVVLTLGSLSKSGIIGLLLGLSFLAISALSGRLLALVVAVAIVPFYFLAMPSLDDLLLVQRLQDIGSDWDDSFAARGYFVLLSAQHPLQLWFGLGEEGALKVLGREIHSTYLAFFGLYGLAGGFLYLFFLGSWLRCLFISLPLARAAAIAVPPLFHGIAHNGTRFTVFYVLAALSFSLCEEYRARHPRPEGQPAPPRWATGALGGGARTRAGFHKSGRSAQI